MGSAQPQNVSSRSLTNVLRVLRGRKKSQMTSALTLGDTDKGADQDHDHNLNNLLDRCRTKGTKLNKAKL